MIKQKYNKIKIESLSIAITNKMIHVFTIHKFEKMKKFVFNFIFLISKKFL